MVSQPRRLQLEISLLCKPQNLHVCTYFNLHKLQFQFINTSCMEAVALIRLVFLHLIAKMSNQFLEQWINITFCMQLEKNTSDTCANALQDLWGRSYEKVKCFGVPYINDSKRAACQNHKWRKCSSLSSITRILLILNSFHKVK
jgi:hypothetical protein